MPYSTIDELRAARDVALAASDIYMFEDAPPFIGTKDLLIAYRQELRDRPQYAAEHGLTDLELPDSGFLARPVDPEPSED
ncbi:MAG TPA: hypothetical protein DEP13_04780 [Gammaproteobacteria bacterium]|nr:hypothetical protein [Gammaproteobacteria bacterium]